MIFFFINILLFLKLLLGTTEGIHFEDDFDISREKRAVLRNLKYRWNESIIYYKIEANFNNKHLIKQALSNIMNNSCLQFEEISENDHDTNKTGFNFYEGGVYKTNLGRKLDFGHFQNISLASKNASYRQIYRWILYALGLDFEHNRPDRNDYVVVHKKHILKKFSDYTVRKDNSEVKTYGLRYDFNSIMSLDEFDYQAYNDTITFERKHHGYTNEISNNEQLAPYDKILLNRYYCTWKCGQQFDCQNGGYQDSQRCDRCKCSDEYEGLYCQHPKVLGKQKCLFTDVNITNMKPDGFNSDLSFGCGFSITSPPGTVIAIEYIFRDDIQPNQAYGETGVAEIKFEKNKFEPGLIISNVNKKGSFYSEDNYVLVRFESKKSIRLRLNVKPIYIDDVKHELTKKIT